MGLRPSASHRQASELRDCPPLRNPFALSARTLRRLPEARALSAWALERVSEGRALRNGRSARLSEGRALRNEALARLSEARALSAWTFSTLSEVCALGDGTLPTLRRLRALSLCRLARLSMAHALSARRLPSVSGWFVPNCFPLLFQGNYSGAGQDRCRPISDRFSNNPGSPTSHKADDVFCLASNPALWMIRFQLLWP